MMLAVIGFVSVAAAKLNIEVSANCARIGKGEPLRPIGQSLVFRDDRAAELCGQPANWVGDRRLVRRVDEIA